MIVSCRRVVGISYEKVRVYVVVVVVVVGPRYCVWMRYICLLVWAHEGEEDREGGNGGLRMKISLTGDVCVWVYTGCAWDNNMMDI